MQFEQRMNGYDLMIEKAHWLGNFSILSFSVVSVEGEIGIDSSQVWHC
jgi:hypothetical protein